MRQIQGVKIGENINNSVDSGTLLYVSMLFITGLMMLLNQYPNPVKNVSN